MRWACRMCHSNRHSQPQDEWDRIQRIRKPKTEISFRLIKLYHFYAIRVRVCSFGRSIRFDIFVRLPLSFFLKDERESMDIGQVVRVHSINLSRFPLNCCSSALCWMEEKNVAQTFLCAFIHVVQSNLRYILNLLVFFLSLLICARARVLSIQHSFSAIHFFCYFEMMYPYRYER